jgi:hypothetical protein
MALTKALQWIYLQLDETLGGPATYRGLWSRFGALCAGSGESLTQLFPDILNTQIYASRSLLCVRYTADASISAWVVLQRETRSRGEILRR